MLKNRGLPVDKFMSWKSFTRLIGKESWNLQTQDLLKRDKAGVLQDFHCGKLLILLFMCKEAQAGWG
jgi:hypothetical protein